ncbi:hypothetical protein MAPG_05956 [Magnaporthiopsis poae ATCC 64411]|uniref:Uncharacterized protein n=1 Tax=Magnaporthiopsis poae (strain ATCC 64411 / 73-15) TaxID=644358 RepID=A0A0C4E0S2_MAGP6|nr:hypothetical protein MAPG_05956 [Magnaporthiopsis poae ATCC 64411]
MSAPTLYKAGEEDFEVEGVIACDDAPDVQSKHVQVSIKRMRQFDRRIRRLGPWITASGRVPVRRETVKPRPDGEMTVKPQPDEEMRT